MPADAQPPDSAAAPALPPLSEAELPIARLTPEFLGGFFELCFPDKRLVQLCRTLEIHTPGYRLEALPPDQVARILADEFAAAKDVRSALEEAVREVLRRPALEEAQLGQEQLLDALDLISRGDPLQQIARIAWKALLSPDESVQAVAAEAIEEGIALLDAPPPRPLSAKPARPAELEKSAASALKKAERADRDKAALKEQLSQVRAVCAVLEEKLGAQRAELHEARAESAKAQAEVSRLLAAGEGRALSDARRSAEEARALAERLRRTEESNAALQAELASLRHSARREEPRPATTQKPAEELLLPTEQESAEFLVPILTREFYDSIERWDRRMQRAAFDKIHLLAQNWRHGSLRAILLEGVPGYYRIRVATDVRLIYRREGSRLEILSLIDREDLDRYIRQARTRPE